MGKLFQSSIKLFLDTFSPFHPSELPFRLILHNPRSSESVDKRIKSKLSVLHNKLKVQYRYRQHAATQVHPQEILIHLPTTKNQYLYWPHFIPSQIHAPNTLRVKTDVIWYVTTCIFADISTFRKEKKTCCFIFWALCKVKDACSSETLVPMCQMTLSIRKDNLPSRHQ
jgi:hypothetical protein